MESFGHRQTLTVLDPTTLKVLAELVSWRVDALASEGLCGVRIENGSARVLRFSFAPSKPTTELNAVKASGEFNHAHDPDVLDAFTSRDITRRAGRWAPPGTRIPAGWDTARRSALARRRPNLYGP